MNVRPDRSGRPPWRLSPVTWADACWLDVAECLLADTGGIEAVHKVRHLAPENRRRWFKECGL